MSESLTFEQAIKRLEEIIGQLDSGEATLDKSLELYAESAKLLAFCNQSLEKAELTIKKAFPEELTDEGLGEEQEDS